MSKRKVLDYEPIKEQAKQLIQQMSLEEKISLLGGIRGFFIQGIERLGIKEVLMSDASGGINIRETWLDDRVDTDLERSVAFPCLLSLASTWNNNIAEKYARSIGEECRAGGIGILLGPGMNIYRHSQCGRNFEYLGEDPFLASQMVTSYVEGLQSCGVVATLKHFIGNNSDFYRRKSNSIIGDRALHEIYLPAFKAGVEAGALAVMTSYNLLNGEWCSQNKDLIQGLLRDELGFDGLVMTDWWAINDCEKALLSGLDLEMPAKEIFKEIPQLLKTKKIKVDQIDKMVFRIIYTCLKMDLYNPHYQEKKFLDNYGIHESIALQTAQEGTVLLRNENNLLPLKIEEGSNQKILLTGLFTHQLARGGGASEVEGYKHLNLFEALQMEYGQKLLYRETPSSQEISQADYIILSTGTLDSEGWDRSFSLSEAEEQRIKRIVSLNTKVIVLINSGGGIRMTDWFDDSGAILYGWYGGQLGNRAIVDIISGRVNPSGKLPISIEKEFSDSPGANYIPKGESLYSGWQSEEEEAHPVFSIDYKEDILVGYRWYDTKKIEPLVPFGFGLSYSYFKYSNLYLSSDEIRGDEPFTIKFKITNSGKMDGSEIAQLYIRHIDSKNFYPDKELKAYHKEFLKKGETKEISLKLNKKSFESWDDKLKNWILEEGEYDILIGSSSNTILLSHKISII